MMGKLETPEVNAIHLPAKGEGRPIRLGGRAGWMLPALLRRGRMTARQSVMIEPSSIAVVIFALLVAIAVFLLVDPGPPITERFTPEHVRVLGMVNTLQQRAAYLGFLVTLLLGAICLGITSKRPRHAAVPIVLLALFVVVLLAWTFIYAHEMSRHSSKRESHLVWVVVSAAIFWVSALWSREPKHIWRIWAIAAAYVALMIIPGLIATPIPPRSLLGWIDRHYAMLFQQGPGDGRQLFRDVPVIYGVTLPIGLGLLRQNGYAPSFAELMRSVQAGQILCLLGFLGAAHLATKDAAKADRALAFLLVALCVASRLGTAGWATWFPNQSGVRFLMLPAVPILAALMPRMRPGAAAVLMGATAAFALAHNQETGIAVSAGLAMAWLLHLRDESWSKFLGLTGVAIATSAALAALGTVGYRLAFGDWPAGSNGFGLLSLSAGGYGGVPFRLNPLAMLIMVHAAYFFVRSLQAILNRGAVAPNLLAAAVSTTLLVFFPYYVNRPDEWNLWTFIALYAVMLCPLLTEQGSRTAALLLAAVLVAPTSVASGIRDSISRWKHLELGWHSGCADGLIAEPDICEQLDRRAAALMAIARKGNAVWSTSVPLLTGKMTALRSPIWTADFFAISRTPQAIDQLVKEVHALDASVFLFDDPRDPAIPLPEEITRFNTRLMELLGFVECARNGDWVVARRPADCAEVRE